MKISLDIDPDYEETVITIHCQAVDEKIKDILDFLKGMEKEFIIGKKDDMQHILQPNEIHYFHTKNETVHAVTNDGEFAIKEKLYELENTLPSSQFIRLSKSVIANLYELRRFEPSFNGTLCVYFKSGQKEYVSRHYVPKIKKALKMNRR